MSLLELMCTGVWHAQLVLMVMPVSYDAVTPLSLVLSVLV